jgi:hypothetical protein
MHSRYEGHARTASQRTHKVSLLQELSIGAKEKLALCDSNAGLSQNHMPSLLQTLEEGRVVEAATSFGTVKRHSHPLNSLMQASCHWTKYPDGC